MTLTRTHLLGFVGLVALAFALYWAKAEAQAVREQVLVLQNQVDTERRAVRTLQAELTWVERPDRLEAAATQKLGLVPVTADRIATMDEIDQVAPLRVAEPTSTSTSTLAATIQENPALKSKPISPKPNPAPATPVAPMVAR